MSGPAVLIRVSTLRERARPRGACADARRRHRSVAPQSDRRFRASKLLGSHGDVLDALPRLQGLVRRRAGDPRAPARATATSRSRAAATSRSSTPAASRTRRSRSRARRRRAPPARTRRVYVTGCAREPPEARFAGLAGRTSSSSRAERGRGGRRSSPATSARSAASRPTRGSIGCARSCKIQDGCSFSCAFCVIPLVRGATRSRSAARRARRDPAARRAGPPRDRADRRQPRLLPRPRGRATRCARLVREAGAIAGRRAAAALVDRGQPRRRRRSSRRCARRRRSRRTCTCRSSRATTACCARWAAATRSRSTCAQARAARTTST